MRSLLTLLGGALVVFLILGYYLNWYSIAKEPGKTPGTHHLEIDINTKKINEDVQRGVKAGADRIGDLINKSPEQPAPK
jgi:hypothetical protein